MILLGIGKYSKTIIDTRYKESEEDLKPFIKQLDEYETIVKLDNDYNLIETINGEITQEEINNQLISYKKVIKEQLI